uniref:HTH psq-type domain-containing protein n=1 Tax=Meloidogyne incognita TaxID=6306 RepID=A0A914MT34_MELIC
MPRKRISNEVKDQVINDKPNLTIKQAAEKYGLSTGTIWNIYNKYDKQEAIVVHKTPIMNKTFVFDSPIASRTRNNKIKRINDALNFIPIDFEENDFNEVFIGCFENPVDMIDNPCAHQNDVLTTYQ